MKIKERGLIIMQDLVIIENKSVGLLEFGMSEEEVKKCLAIYEDFGIRNAYIPFKCGFDYQGKLVFVELFRSSLQEHFRCMFKGINLFELKAPELVKQLNKIYPKDTEIFSLNDCTHSYEDWGLHFWRESAITEEYLETEEFLNMHPSNQEEERNFLYFESISLEKL